MAAPEPAVVQASQGLAWAREGLDALAAAPARWTGITILFLLMGVVLSVIPFAGLLWSVVVPIHIGGLMLGCHALRHGRPLEVRYLFNGFEEPHLKRLALVGALYLAGSLVVMLPLMIIVVGTSLFSAAVVGSTGGSVPALVGVAIVAVLVIALAMAGGFLLSMALWFAPALVVFDAMDALEALKLSLRASWANVGAFVVYGLVLLGIGLVVAAPLVSAILLVSTRGADQSGPFAVILIGGTGLFLGFCILVLMPAMWGAMYASYAAVFGDPATTR